MSTAQNKELVRRWFEEVWNRQDDQSIPDMLDRNTIAHGLAMEPVGYEGFIEFRKSFISAFPDIKVFVDDVIAEDDRVAIRWHAGGTLKGEGLGVTPTQRGMSVMGFSIVRIRDGKIVEAWNNFDVLGMHRQLGTLSQLK